MLDPAILGRYDDVAGPRELRCLHVPNGIRLVLDWRVPRRSDPRVVGRLNEDEPPSNACLLAELYLADSTRGHCRPLRATDLQHVAASNLASSRSDAPPSLRDAEGAIYGLASISCANACAQVRWVRHEPGAADTPPLSLREVIARLQAYEPARSITLRAIARYDEDPNVSVVLLRAELERLDASPTVLNRALREAVCRAVEAGTSLSEIAIRCGRVKTGPDHSGETSWLSRRVGLLPEGGKDVPTSWVHSDVLALIARDGLRVSPVEVEVL
jgi:hypothetical protein